MESFKQIEQYLLSLTNYEVTGFNGMKGNLNLDRLNAFLRGTGYPQKTYKSIHVAGTKGKGSICTFAASILTHAGYKVGLFTSPHLNSVRERISVNGNMITEEDFVEVVQTVKSGILPEQSEMFTYFEVITLAAIIYFKKMNVDFVVFETGLGGRWDATNVIDSDVSCISPVSFDHTDILGNTLAKIAEEKAAIIKYGSACISAPQKSEVLDVIKRRCKEQNAALHIVGEDTKCSIKDMNYEGTIFDVAGEFGIYSDCLTTLPGDFQVENCAAALAICGQILKDSPMRKSDVRKGIERAFIPGRLEVLCREPYIVIDGAQNAESAVRLKYSIEDIFKYDRLILLAGIARDKEIKPFCREIRPLADEIILTKASNSRAADPFLLRGYFKGRKVKVAGGVKEALGLALSLANKKDLILATGSFYLIGELRRYIVDCRP